MFEQCLDQIAVAVDFNVRAFWILKFFDIINAFKKNYVSSNRLIFIHSVGHDIFGDIIDARPNVFMFSF